KTNDENKNKKLTIQINKNINFNKLYCMFFINQWCQTTFSDNTYRIFILKKTENMLLIYAPRTTKTQPSENNTKPTTQQKNTIKTHHTTPHHTTPHQRQQLIISHLEGCESFIDNTHLE
ncbi:TPA: hypothetical protein ACJFQS_005042, partial [Escherichia coli]